MYIFITIEKFNIINSKIVLYIWLKNIFLNLIEVFVYENKLLLFLLFKNLLKLMNLFSKSFSIILSIHLIDKKSN